jgi:uncharacterized membrane protein YgaE (UPF0421/DUF939 family)
MSFVTLFITIAVVTLVASMVTNFLRGVLLVISGLAISYYFLIAGPSEKKELDKYTKNFNIQKYLDVDVEGFYKKITDKFIDNKKEPTK